MRQIINSTSLAALLVTLIVSVMAKNQHRDVRKTEPSDTKDGLQLSVELDKESFRLDETPTLKIRLRNVSQSPISIYKKMGWGRSSSFTISISVVQGELGERRFLEDALDHPPFPAEDFITIRPGESVERERLLDLRGDGIKSPGIYKATVRYHSPIPREFAPSGLKVWAMENGVLQSKPASLKVTH